MFGFPIGNGNAGFNDFVEKFTNNADIGFPKIQQREVFYTIKDGNWNDITIWQTASGRIGNFPTSIDDVYIRHSIVANTITTINNLFVSGALSVTTAISLTFNNIRCYGSLINNGGTFKILGNENYIEKSLYQFISGSIEYQGNNQPILDLNYGNLTLSSSGTKYLVQDLVVNGPFLLSFPAIFDVYGYNITMNSSTTINSTMNATGTGSYLFVGSVSFPVAGINFVGNPTMEFRGGMSFGTGSYTNNLGTGDINITTNNQSITSSSGGLFFNNAIKIASGITLTFPSNTTTTLNSTINGLGALSKLVNSGGSNLVFTTQSGCENLMSTGIYDITTSANTITFGGNYSATIPSLFTTFHSLTISGTGTKTLSANTTLNGNLTSNSSGNFQLSTFNLIVTGTSTLQGTGVIYPLQKSGAGSVTFIGALITGNSSYSFDFSAGNPSFEFRSGMTLTNQTATTIKTGTGTYTFSTNNQTITFVGNNIFQFEGLVNIGSALTLTISDGAGGGSNQTKQIVLNSASGINGLSAGSTLIIGNNTGLRINQPSTTIMSTGVFTPSTNSGSLFQINYTGNSTIPYTSFADLFISNIGIKTLSGNTTINNFINRNLTSSSQQLECSTFNLTINSTSTLGSPAGSTTYILSKSGSGNILFIGLVTLENNSTRLIDFTGGNPSVELRGGISTTSPSTTQVKTGTGTWTFSTNNQNITQLAGVGTLQLDTSILISGAITLSQVNSSSSAFTLISTGTINGNNASSTFAMGTASGTNTLNYQSATQPMATGVLNTSTNLNTWIYGLNNQDIKGNIVLLTKQVYRNLTLNGTGVKTLQGYVSVLNTYTLTAPATLALNGFTLTNP